MNQGKLDMVKQEMIRVNINILGISELKWTGTGELNSVQWLTSKITGGEWGGGGSKVQERGNVCILMADSCCGRAETNTTL